MTDLAGGNTVCIGTHPLELLFVRNATRWGRKDKRRKRERERERNGFGKLSSERVSGAPDTEERKKQRN